MSPLDAFFLRENSLSLFWYQGEPRIELWFGTPNRCAIVLAMMALVGSGVLLETSTWSEKRTGLRWLLIALASLIGALFFAIGFTYSRGGYIAMAIGLATLALVARRRRKVAFGLAGAFALALILTPQGVNRINGVTAIKTDRSISNRLILWRGAMAITADNWAKGVGFSRFRETYTAWYQPAPQREIYKSAVNDYLTISSAAGIFTLAAYLVLGLGSVAVACQLTSVTGNMVYAGLAAALVAYLAGAGASTFIIYPRVFSVAAALVLITWLAAALHERRMRSIDFRKAILGGLLGAAIACLGLLGAARIAANSYSYRPVVALPPFLGDTAAIAPRHQPAIGTVFWIADHWRTDYDAREFMQPLATAGYNVVVLQPEDFGFKGIEVCQSYLKRTRVLFPPPYILAGSGEGGQFAALPELWSDLPASKLVLVGVRYWIPVPRLSLRENLSQIKIPLLVLQGQHDMQTDANDAKLIGIKAAATGVDAKIIVVPSADHKLTGKWPEIMDILRLFLAQISSSVIIPQ